MINMPQVCKAQHTASLRWPMACCSFHYSWGQEALSVPGILCCICLSARGLLLDPSWPMTAGQMIARHTSLQPIKQSHAASVVLGMQR